MVRWLGILDFVARDRNLRRRIQQRFGFLEISSVKALGKPSVDPSEHIVRFLPFPLLVPEATQTHGCPQLQGFCFLAAGEGPPTRGSATPTAPGYRPPCERAGTCRPSARPRRRPHRDSCADNWRGAR